MQSTFQEVAPGVSEAPRRSPGRFCRTLTVYRDDGSLDPGQNSATWGHDRGWENAPICRVGMCHQGGGAPRRVVHRHTALLELRTHRAVEDDYLSPIEPLPQIAHLLLLLVALRQSVTGFQETVFVYSEMSPKRAPRRTASVRLAASSFA